MKRRLRPHVIVIGCIAAALIAWTSAASAAGARNGSHFAVGNAKALQVANSVTHDPTPVPNSETAPQASREAQEQDEQAEDSDEQNENEQADEKPTPPPATVTSDTFALVGGTVTFSCSGNVISLVSAVPNSSFAVETERENGGREVKVKFESNTHKSEIQATCVGGQVQASEIQEESE